MLAPLVLRKMTAMESTAGRRMPRALLVGRGGAGVDEPTGGDDKPASTHEVLPNDAMD